MQLYIILHTHTHTHTHTDTHTHTHTHIYIYIYIYIYCISRIEYFFLWLGFDKDVNNLQLISIHGYSACSLFIYLFIYFYFFFCYLFFLATSNWMFWQNIPIVSPLLSWHYYEQKIYFCFNQIYLSNDLIILLKAWYCIEDELVDFATCQPSLEYFYLKNSLDLYMTSNSIFTIILNRKNVHIFFSNSVF